ncbi:DUF3168 domain-containing protein [Paracoccus denitrificans]|jgi:hypothetical protein|nr:DUF3168 domain-containing protein [Paracoccus denitrificans]QAR26555.1 DUF3168 domain-containing protein [Paracoccus denitrificans]GEK71344.1 hypothetical protein PDE01_48640 [Paracoccus denitrificans]SDJ90458.1 Protein of unknown function [Paracoccus denitrificans]SFR22999.1 Protein of unknown function [Paracoccus denitrificans]
MRAGRKLREIVRARIIGHVEGLEGRVIDKAMKSTPYPYATLGPSYWVDDISECILARDVTLQIDLWDSQVNKGRLEDLTDDVATALRGWSDTDALTMHPMRVTLARVMDDPDGVSVHGVVQVEALVEG